PNINSNDTKLYFDESPNDFIIHNESFNNYINYGLSYGLYMLSTTSNGSPISITNISCYQKLHTAYFYPYQNFSQFSSCDEYFSPLDSKGWKFSCADECKSIPKLPINTFCYREPQDQVEVITYRAIGDPISIDHITLNITSNVTSSPNASLPDYFGIIFSRIIINDKAMNLYFNMIPIPPWSLGRGLLFGLKPENNVAYIDVDVKELSPITDSSYTLLIIKPKNHIVRYIEEDSQSFVTILANIGGLYAGLTALYTICFGTRRLSPWGYCQTFPCWWPLRRIFKRHFARHYVSKAGVPFVEDPRKLPPGASIEHRVAVLENLLKEYYLDTSYLELLKDTREKYIDFNKTYQELEETNTDDISDEENKHQIINKISKR
ncbi:10278_t:CDS:2, partial [Racocetra persica]